MVGETITNVWDALIALNKLVDTPFLDPTIAPRPTGAPIPVPTVAPGNPTNPPTRVPTPAPTRTPIVVTSVSLSGISCADFDADVFQTGLDKTIGEGDASFSDL